MAHIGDSVFPILVHDQPSLLSHSLLEKYRSLRLEAEVIVKCRVPASNHDKVGALVPLMSAVGMAAVLVVLDIVHMLI